MGIVAGANILVVEDQRDDDDDNDECVVHPALPVLDDNAFEHVGAVFTAIDVALELNLASDRSWLDAHEPHGRAALRAARRRGDPGGGARGTAVRHGRRAFEWSMRGVAGATIVPRASR